MPSTTDNQDEFLNSPKKFHLEMPLYYEIKVINEDVEKIIFSILNYKHAIDAFCIKCKKESVFHMSYGTNFGVFESWRLYTKFDKVAMKCSRNEDHEYIFFYMKSQNTFQKVGQFPSTGDFQIPQTEKYRKILGESSYKELTRGIGLATHGVGIGSFVYLQKIFENLIKEAYSAERSDDGFPEEEYHQSRMSERIQLLKGHIPEFLVKNKNIYSILSKGIHNLSEEECLRYFTPLRIGIEQILDEKIEHMEKSKKDKMAQEVIQKITNDMSRK